MDNQSLGDRKEFLEEIEKNIEFIARFKRSSYGIIALKNGYTLEDARKAGLLK